MSEPPRSAPAAASTASSPPEWLGWLAFSGCCAIWGSTFLFISIGNETMPALWAGSLRLALAGVLLTALAFATGGGLPRGAALRAAAIYGVLNMGCSFALLYWSEKYVASSLAAVVYATIPLSAALFARWFGLERLNPVKLGAAAVALGGVVAIFWSRLYARQPAVPFALLVVAATLGSLSGVVLKRGPRQSAFGANAVASWIGLVVCLAASFIEREPHPWPASSRAIFPIVYLALAGSVGAFVLYIWLLQRWKISRISFVAVIVPVIALILGAITRHERVSGLSLAGVGLVFAGLALGIAADRLKR